MRTSNTKTQQPEITQGKLPFWQQIVWNLAFAFAILAIIPVAVTTLVITPQLTEHEENKTVGQLSSVAELKIDQIERWLSDSEQAIELLTVDNNTEKAL